MTFLSLQSHKMFRLAGLLSGPPLADSVFSSDHPLYSQLASKRPSKSVKKRSRSPSRRQSSRDRSRQQSRYQPRCRSRSPSPSGKRLCDQAHWRSRSPSPSPSPSRKQSCDQLDQMCKHLEAISHVEQLKKEYPKLYITLKRMAKSMDRLPDKDVHVNISQDTDGRFKTPDYRLYDEDVYMNISPDIDWRFNQLGTDGKICIFFNKHKNSENKFDEKECLETVKSLVKRKQDFFGKDAIVSFRGENKTTVAIYHANNKTLQQVKEVVFGEM